MFPDCVAEGEAVDGVIVAICARWVLRSLFPARMSGVLRGRWFRRRVETESSLWLRAERRGDGRSRTHALSRRLSSLVESTDIDGVIHNRRRVVDMAHRPRDGDHPCGRQVFPPSSRTRTLFGRGHTCRSRSNAPKIGSSLAATRVEGLSYPPSSERELLQTWGYWMHYQRRTEVEFQELGTKPALCAAATRFHHSLRDRAPVDRLGHACGLGLLGRRQRLAVISHFPHDLVQERLLRLAAFVLGHANPVRGQG